MYCISTFGSSCEAQRVLWEEREKERGAAKYDEGAFAAFLQEGYRQTDLCVNVDKNAQFLTAEEGRVLLPWLR